MSDLQSALRRAQRLHDARGASASPAGVLREIEGMFLNPQLNLQFPGRELVQMGELILESEATGRGETVWCFLFTDCVLLGTPVVGAGGASKLDVRDSMRLVPGMTECRVSPRNWVVLQQRQSAAAGGNKTLVLHGATIDVSRSWCKLFEDALYGAEQINVAAQLAEATRKLDQLSETKSAIVEKVRSETRARLATEEQRVQRLQAEARRFRGLADGATTTDGGALYSADYIASSRSKTQLLEAELEQLTGSVRSREAELAQVEHDSVVAKRAAAEQLEPLKNVVAGLKSEEARLGQFLIASGRQGELEQFVRRRRGLEVQESEMRDRLARSEDELDSQLRALYDQAERALASEPASRSAGGRLAPDERQKLELYAEWKKLAWEKNRLERVGREERCGVLSRARSEGERRAILESLRCRAELTKLRDEEASLLETTLQARTRIRSLDEEMREAALSMRQYRGEFEQMRGALMLEQSIKEQQTTMIAEQKKKLESAERSYAEELAEETRRVEDEVRAEWAPRLDAAGAEARAFVRTQEDALQEKLEHVRQTLHERYRSGFAPLLEEAQARCEEEATKARALEDAIAKEEAELAAMKRELGEPSAGGSATEAADPAAVRSVQTELRAMWAQLGTPAEEIASFLESLELATPHSDAVLRVYEQASARLARGEDF